MATEIELKLRIPKSCTLDIQQTLKTCLGVGDFERRDLHNVYFDTPDLQLHRAEIALRIRAKQGRYIQTLKTKGVAHNGLHSRGEWEWPVAKPELEIALLQRCEAWPACIDPRCLVPVFETNFSRDQVLFDWQGATLELALDQGSITSTSVTDKVDLIHELEIELKAGEPSVLVTLGQQLRHLLPVEPDNVSKAERGYHLFKTAAPWNR